MTVTSTDGYCSLIHFSLEELGTPYRGPLGVGAAPTSTTATPVATSEQSAAAPQTPVSVGSASVVESTPLSAGGGGDEVEIMDV